MYSSKMNLYFPSIFQTYLTRPFPNHPNSQLLQIHFATIPQIHFLPQSPKFTIPQIHFATIPPNTPNHPIPQIHFAPSHSLRLRPSPLCRPCGARWSVNIIMIMIMIVKRMMMMMAMVMMMPHKLLYTSLHGGEY